MSLLQAGVWSMRTAVTDWEGPASQMKEALSNSTGALPLWRGHFAELLEVGTRRLKAASLELSEEFPDPLLSLYFFAVFLFMSLAALSCLIKPELILYADTAYGIIYGCTPSGQPFPGLPGALGAAGRPHFPGGVGAQALQLCPELLVPEDSFCTLVAPIRPLRLGPFDITSTDGTVLLRVLPHAEVRDQLADEIWSTSGDGFKRLFTVTTKQGVALAHGGEAIHTPRGRPTEFQLLSASEGVSASLAFGRAENQYVLTMANGGCVVFWGSADFRTIHASSGTGKRVAVAKMCKCKFDPTGDYCCTRVEPGVDAGLILCCLLCINHIGDYLL